MGVLDYKTARKPQIVRAIMANAVAGCQAWAAWPEMRLHTDREVVRSETSVPAAMFNNVYRLRARGDRAEQILSALMTRQTPLRCWVSPGSLPRDLGSRLTTLGWTLRFSGMGMARELGADLLKATDQTAHTVERVTTLAGLQEWASVFVKTFSLADAVGSAWYEIHATMFDQGIPWHHYLVRGVGGAVGISSLYYGCGVAGIANVTTLPQVRRQGIGAALTQAPLRDAYAAGYRVSTLIATPMATGIYRSLGFSPYCNCDFYVWNG